MRWLLKSVAIGSLLVILGCATSSTATPGVGPTPTPAAPRTPVAQPTPTVAAATPTSSPPNTPPPSADMVLVASKLSVLAVTVATGGSGHGFLDNFLPCPRRGVVDYRDVGAGRHATFSGCDLGDGVTVEGSAEFRWVGLTPERSTPSSLELTGEVAVRVAGSGPVHVDRMAVEGIAFREGMDPARGREEEAVWPALEGLLLPSLRATLLGRTVSMDERASPRHVFGAEGLSINSIPNLSGGLKALTEPDSKRLAYHFAVRLLAILFDETLEYQRGPHTHDLGCGTLSVLQDTARRLPRLEETLRDCAVLGEGLVVDGNFGVEWGDFDPNAGRWPMVVQGRFTVGGGVPRATLTRVEWTLTGVPPYPANARISGQITGDNGEQRTFSFDLLLDD